MHETLARSLAAVPWFGLGTIDHFEPFQRSMSVLVADDAVTDELPTAKQKVALAHDTPPSPFCVAPGAFGLATTDQLDTSGRSTNVTVIPLGFVY